MASINSEGGAPIARAPLPAVLFSRNPLYVALAGTLAGIALLLASSWLLLAAAVLVAMLNALVIPAEERILAAEFPEEFQSYRMRIRRWI